MTTPIENLINRYNGLLDEYQAATAAIENYQRQNFELESYVAKLQKGIMERDNQIAKFIAYLKAEVKP